MLVATTCVIYYEVLSITWDILPKLQEILPKRLRVVFVVFAIFVGHTICVWFYAIAYWLLTHYADYGTLYEFADDHRLYSGSFMDCLYFSTVTYSSLGFGDLVPKSYLRILAGIQAVNGLVLIGWSVSSTYLAMEKFWVIRGERRKQKRSI